MARAEPEKSEELKSTALCVCERGELEFGENGAVKLLTDTRGNIAREMDDFEILIESRPRYSEIATTVALATTSSTALLIYMVQSNLLGQQMQFFALITLALIGLFCTTGALGCYAEAAANGEIGTKKNKLPRPAHITGLGGTVAILLLVAVALIFILGEWQPYGFELPGSVGNGTFVALSLAFIAVFLSSRIPAPSSLGEMLEKIRTWTSGVQRLGLLLSRVDAFLVHGIAPLAGVTLLHPFHRYIVLLTQIACGGFLAWYCPPPFGLIGAVWVFLLVFAIVRRWGWIEHVRSSQQHNINAIDQRRIRQIVDLRDEAMIGLLLLVIVMPVAMRQVHLIVPSSQGFLVSGNSLNDVFSWTGFFGVELPKALPFLDWADIYGARNGANIHTSGAVSMHAVFIARMIIDLVFLAALIQWVSISVAIERNKRDFLTQRNGTNSLDERIERNHISRLVKAGKDGAFIPTILVEQYKHYDTLALSRLKLRYKNDARLIAAIQEISRASGKPVSVPSEELIEEAYRPSPRAERLMAILGVIEREKDYDFENLLLARSELNRKGRLENERKYLVQLMVLHVPPSVERDQHFAEILSGEDADSLRDVRRLVIDTLVRNAKRNTLVLSYLRTAASSDKSKAVREHAMRSMAKFGISQDAAINVDQVA